MADELQMFTSEHDLNVDISTFWESSGEKNADRTHYYDVKVLKYCALFSFRVKNFEDIVKVIREKYELYRKLHG